MHQDDETFSEMVTNLEFTFKVPVGYHRIVGSCLGLVCLSDDLFGELKNIIIWNPSIKKNVGISLPKKLEWPHMFVLGFGVCPITCDPKVVKIAYGKELSEDASIKYRVPPQVDIYAVSSGSWKNASCDCPPYSMVEFTWSQAFVNGAIHWMAYDRRVGGRVRNLIMSFNIVNEVFHEMTLPDVLASARVPDLFVTLYGESLGVLQYDSELDSCCIWVMKEHGVLGSCTKLFTVNLPILAKTVGFRKNGDALLALRDSNLVSYEPKSGHMKSCGLVGNIRSFYVGTYMETLLLLNGESRVREEDNQFEE